MTESLSGIKSVFAFCGEVIEHKKYFTQIILNKDAAFMVGLYSSLIGGAVDFLIYSSYGLGLWCGATLIQSDGITGGLVITVFNAMMWAAFSLGQIANLFPLYNAALSISSCHYVINLLESITRILEIKEVEPSNEFECIIPQKEYSSNFTLKIVDLFFSYPSRPDISVLNGINLDVPFGSAIALTGSTGCGKSSILSLILKFYSPKSGNILIDNDELSHNFRKHIGYVGQEAVIFVGTIYENITCFEDIDINIVIAAAKKACIDEFISDLPLKYETILNSANMLSGGQKQRICLARIFLKKPKLLLLDEITSALDSKSEASIQKTIDELIASRTTTIIMIAHRLKTVKRCDSIYYFEKGKIAESGSHDYLLSFDSNYKRMLDIQNLQDYDSGSIIIARRASTATSHFTNPDIENITNFISHSRNNSQLVKDYPSNLDSFENIDSINSSLPRSLSFLSPKKINTIPIDLNDKEEEISNLTLESILIKLLELLKESAIKTDSNSLIILCLGFCGGILNGLCNPFFALLLSSFLNAFYLPNMMDIIVVYSILFFVLGIGAFFAITMQKCGFTYAGEDLLILIKSSIFKKLLCSELSYFDKELNAPDNLVPRINENILIIKKILTETAPLIIQYFATILFGFIMALWQGWQLGLFIFATSPILYVSIHFESLFLTEFQCKIDKLSEQTNMLGQEIINEMKTVWAVSGEFSFLRKFELQILDKIKNCESLYLVTGIAYGISVAIQYLIYAISFSFGGWLVLNNIISSSALFSVFFAVSVAAISISLLLQQIQSLNRCKIAFQNDSNNSSLPSRTYDIAVAPEIKFDKVTFSYPSRPTAIILNKLSLAFPAGKVTALVGSSGSGKSTIGSLLLRFYQPNSGAITLNGYNISTFSTNSTRKKIAFVPQEPILFSNSIKDNINYGQEVVSQSQFEKAVLLANANFIYDFPSKEDTLVGSKGRSLSGGQKQRIMIARALNSQPTTIILDEATAALDSQTEKIFFDTFLDAFKGTTRIIIAHTATAMKTADHIIMLESGKVAEMGSFDELMNKKGLFASYINNSKNFKN